LPGYCATPFRHADYYADYELPPLAIIFSRHYAIASQLSSRRHG
jgi:hypothetical protein